MALALPCLDILRELASPDYGRHKTLLFSRGRRLLLAPRQVVLVDGAVVSRTLNYTEDIVTATYTRFLRGNDPELSEALVVCFTTSAHVYYPLGTSYTVSLPFLLKLAFPFDLGLLLQRANGLHDGSALLLPAYRFFTVVDPIGDLRVVTTSSTSVVGAHESLMYFPSKGLNSARSLCVTFNPRQRVANVYHVKASSRNNVVGSANFRKKRHYSVSTPNPSRILEEDNLYESIPGPFAPSHSLSVKMEKKRTSTLLSGISSIARMATESGLSDTGKLSNSITVSELGALRKDMIWNKVDTISIKARRLHLTVGGLVYEDEEAVVISNQATKTTLVHIYKLADMSSKLLSSLHIDCLHAMPLDNEPFRGWLVVLKTERSLQLVNPFLNITAPEIPLDKYPPITSISSTVDNLVALVSGANRKTYVINLLLEPVNRLVSSCLKTWTYLTGSKINEHIWVIWRTALTMDEMKNEWNAFVTMLLSLIFPFEELESKPIKVENEVTKLIPNAKILHEHFTIDYSFHDLLPYIVVSLHLLYEENKLDHLGKLASNKLGTLLTQLTVWTGWLEHWDTYYMIDHKFIDSEVRLLLVVLLYQPPNIYESLTGLFEGKPARYLKFSQLVEESDDVNMLITPRTWTVLNLFEQLASPGFDVKDVVNSMCEYGVKTSDLDTYPPGISIPLKHCLLACQSEPDPEWSSEALDLVGRKDLASLLQSHSMVHGKKQHFLEGTMESGRNTNDIVASIFSKNDSFVAWDGQSEADHISITKLMFDKDRRYYEITSLLHQTRTPTATLVVNEEASEYDSTLMKRELASRVAMRTLTIPLGRAALFYGGRIPLLTEKFPIPKFNLNTIISPSMTKIVYSEGTLDLRITEWGHFHNGVSSGLSISPDSKGISGSWVIFNKPVQNNAQHAGFLLGLGLNGHLKKLEEWHIYNYLGPKHPLTSVGLLIGMAASLRGTMDNKLTKVLSVHAVALLPQGASDLNVPIMVQSAGLIGIGLLYLETQHRRMSEILLSQFGGNSLHVENHEEQEGYRLAAGIALGFINLGKGDDLKSLVDTHVVDKLLAYAVLMKDSHPVFESDKSGSGATLALGLIYLKTRNAVIASKLQIPSSEQLLDYIRPDLLLLRCLASNLIMWDKIDNTKLWVESEIPDVLRKKYSISSIDVLDSDQVPYFNILGGACLSLAIRYASSHNIEARNTLMYYLDIFMMLSTANTNNYDQKIAFNSACQIQNLLALSVSVVMAGSGDLEVFRRLRVLHGRITLNVGYGNHMAFSMALGILFLGGSQYGFGNSNFSIACLIVSLYPVFPGESSEHEVHMQVLRHFWALSITPRCFVVRDVTDGSPIKIPVKLTTRSGVVKDLQSPFLLANLKDIAMIEVQSKEHFKVKLDFLLNSEYLERFKKTLTILVLKKRNYELLETSVSALLEAKGRTLQTEERSQQDEDLKRLMNLRLMDCLSGYEKDVYVRECGEGVREVHPAVVRSGLSLFDIIDHKIELHQLAAQPKCVEDLLNLKLLFCFTDLLLQDGQRYIDAKFFETLKHIVWGLAEGVTAAPAVK